METQIKVLQEMMANNEGMLKEAHLWDGDIHCEVFYNMIRVHWNGGSGCSHESNYADALKDASNDSWRRIYESQTISL